MSGVKVGPQTPKLMLGTKEMVAEPLAVKVCWWVWTLCRDDRNGVDAKDLCPSPNQCCLDGFEFVDRVGSNRGSDPDLHSTFLAIFPVPQLHAQSNRVEIVWRVDVGVNLRRPSWVLQRLGRRKLEFHDNDRWRKADGDAQFSSALPSLQRSEVALGGRRKLRR